MWSGLISFFVSQWDMVHSNINQEYSIHSCLFLHIFTGYVTSTSEMALIGSVNHGYGTDACLHYTLNDIMLQMTQVFIFTFVVQ